MSHIFKGMGHLWRISGASMADSWSRTYGASLYLSSYVVQSHFTIRI